MPAPWGGGGGGGGARRGGGGRAAATNTREGSDDIRKFLSFYKRRNSLCVDLYLPAFYQKKPTYEDLAEFVYSVLSVGGTSPPQVVRAGVQDIQLHPVKKLLFIKFTEQQLRDEVVTRLQNGLVWPEFDTTVTGWSMDKPVERVRVLGTSPETTEADMRKILGQYGEILDAQKGYISRKLPGCTNGIWTVRLVMRAGMCLPPFLVMKDEGEVWQLATGETSVCWKCGQSGHIGDKCRQPVTVLAESIASLAVGNQPSWAHVVKGGVSVVPTPPPPPPGVQARPGLFRDPFKVTRNILTAAKAALKVHKVTVNEVSKEVVVVKEPELALEVPAVELEAAPAVQEASMDVQFSDNVEDGGKGLQDSQGFPQKKPKLSEGVGALPRDPRLRAKVSGLLSVSPELHHKVPAGARHGAISGGSGLQNVEAMEQEEVRSCGEVGDIGNEGEGVGLLSEGVIRQGLLSEGEGNHLDDANREKHMGVKTNMFGVKYLMWFEIGIEGKDPMDPKEEDWGGTIEFGYSEKTFCKDIED